MTTDTAYTMLISSLPYLGSLFEVRYSVISRIKLERRLNVLNPNDAKTLSLIKSVTCREYAQGLEDDVQYVNQARNALKQLSDPLLFDIVRHRTELRTLITALRRRHLGQSAPRDGEKWGCGRWIKTIQRNWNEPSFGLHNAFPWVMEAYRLLEGHETIAFERLVLEEVWKELGRKSQGHQFNFIAVVVYVLRWDVMERWTHYQEQAAQERFVHLAKQAIGTHMSQTAAQELEMNNG